MKYLGGKSRIAKRLAAIVNALLPASGIYVEPFLGGCNVLPHVNFKRATVGDVHTDLILLYQAIASGWEPPHAVSEEEYKRVKQHKEPSALRGFVGFACAFSGKWFGGYARGMAGRNYAAAGARGLNKIRGVLQRTELLLNCSYQEIPTPGDALIYCDPPYAGTTGYSTGCFDHAAFWDWVRQKTLAGHVVLVSEYNAPADFVEVWRSERNLNVQTPGKVKIPRIEKIFVHESIA